MSRGYTGRHRGADSAPADPRPASRSRAGTSVVRTAARPIGSFAVLGVVVAASATGLSAASTAIPHTDAAFVTTGGTQQAGFDVSAAMDVPRSTGSDARLTSVEVRTGNAVAADETATAFAAKVQAQAIADQAAADAEAQRQADAAKAARDAQRQAALDNARSDPKAAARAMLANYGWNDSQFSCLDKLFTRESNWNYKARNASSGAYGIPQSLPGSKMASAGSDWQTNPATQIAWGLGYIKNRYGTPCGAWAHSQSTGWY